MPPERHLKAVPEQPEQPPLPIDPPRPGQRVCAWCGQPATTQIMIAPPTFATRKGRRVETKPATWAHSCREHRRHAHHPLAGRAEAAIERKRRRQAAKNQLTIHDALEPEKPAS